MSYVSEIFQPNLIAHDLFELLTGGDLLGRGISRHVFTYRLDDRLVIKFENEDSFQNTYEWQVWNHVKMTALSKWFAPVERISPCGRILIQRRTKPLENDRKLPSQIPAFFTDTKIENWGLLNGKPVCHDYGYHLMLEKGMNKRMRKAEWL